MIVDIQKYSPFSQHTTPYAHQAEWLEKSWNRKYFAFFWEMGTGKSKILIDTAVRLFLAQEIDGVLILSDKGSYRNWAINEIPMHVSPHLKTRTAVWSANMKKKDKYKVEELMQAKDDTLDFMCMNIEALVSKRAVADAERFIRAHYTLMIVDESTSIKSRNAVRSMRARELGKLCDYRRIATGTPITRSPTDAWAQAEFLFPGLLGGWSAFRTMHEVVQPRIMGSRTFNQVIGYQNLDLLQQRIKPWSSRLLKTECLDLPEKIYTTRFVDHTPDQAKIYESLKSLAVAELEQGLVTSTSALTTIAKLQQINCGHVTNDEGERIDIPHNRVSALEDILEEIGDEPVIVWCAFQRDVENIREKFGDRCVTYYGKDSQDKRTEALEKFKSGEAQIFVGTPSTGGKGLTLVNARYVVYYSCGYNLEHRLQSEDRAHRIGQKSDVTYIDLVTPDTVDMRVLKCLRDKQDLAKEILDVYHDLLLEG